jgi:hypothetical protein
MKKNEYYVYALIDPRNQEYFYIGKGKGKRYLTHLQKSNSKRDFNLIKLNRIKEIETAGLEVKSNILFPSLDEETAFELEKALIYKLGREVLSEGILSNINPGGNWKPSDSVLYSSNYKGEFDLNKLDFISQEIFLSINKISDFNYLKTNDNKQIIYKYDNNGNLESTQSVNCFLSNDGGIKGDSIEFLKAIHDNEHPIYRHTAYSKYYSEKIYVSKYLPYPKYEIIDEKFNRDFDELYDRKEKFKINCVISDVLRQSAEKENDIVRFQTYFSSGNKKSYRQTKDLNFPESESYDWFQNGNLKYHEIQKRKSIEYEMYYEDGKVEIEITHNYENGKKTYIRWFANGKKQVELIEDIGYVDYNEYGIIIKTTSLTNQINKIDVNLNIQNLEELIEYMKLTNQI